MTHQVLEEYNSLITTQSHKQGATKLLKLLNNYLRMAKNIQYIQNFE